MLQGIPVSGGFAIGKILKLEDEPFRFDKRSYLGATTEQRRYEAALEAFTQKTHVAASALRRIIGKEEADIFTGHIYMAHDPEMQKNIKEKIAAGFNAETAMESACDSYIEMFLNSASELTRQRAADVRDIKKSMLSVLSGGDVRAQNIPLGSVITAKEFTPSAVRFMDRRRTVAAVAEQGTRGCHFALLMRAMGIPAVLSVKNAMSALHNADRVIVDATKGEIIKL